MFGLLALLDPLSPLLEVSTPTLLVFLSLLHYFACLSDTGNGERGIGVTSTLGLRWGVREDRGHPSCRVFVGQWTPKGRVHVSLYPKRTNRSDVKRWAERPIKSKGEGKDSKVGKFRQTEGPGLSRSEY